jgi:ATP-binding cassette subfamily B protein/subfamily B ATP-binding cassette protein MsbA
MTRRDRAALLRRYGGRQTRHLVVLSACAFVPAVLSALQPLPLKLLVDNALDGEPLTGRAADVLATFGVPNTPHSLVAVAAVAAVVVALAGVLASDLVGAYWEWIGARMVRDASCDLFDSLQRRSLLFHATSSTGDSLSRISSDSSAVYAATNALLVSPLVCVVTLTVVAYSAWHLDPGLTILAAVTAPVLAVSGRYFGRVLSRRAVVERQGQVAVVSFVAQVVQSLPVVQAFTAESSNLRTFRSIADRSRESSRRVTIAEASAQSVESVIAAIGAAVILVVGGRSVLSGSLTVGGLIVFLAYLRTMTLQFRGLLAVGRQFRLASVGLDRLAEVLDANDRLPEPLHPVSFPAAPHGSSVSWEGVVFGYRSDHPVLHDVSLHVERGEMIAFVGPTGAGKTTLAALVPRLFDPWTGCVSVDGVDVRSVALEDARRRVAVVRQSPLILPVSIADNIAMGRPGAHRADIEWAAHEALAAEFIDALPDGYDTVLTEHGSILSGGQRQRLAIARALLKDAPVMVLDEPTSALDPTSEALLVASLERVARDHTLLVIAHRLSTVERADRTVVMENGRIAEHGRHEDLLGDGGRYAGLYGLQSIGATP